MIESGRIYRRERQIAEFVVFNNGYCVVAWGSAPEEMPVSLVTFRSKDEAMIAYREYRWMN